MNQTALALLHCFLNKVKNGVYGVVFLIKDLKLQLFYVLLFLCPVYWQVLNSKSLPEVGYDFRNSVDHMGNFIADYEFDILA